MKISFAIASILALSAGCATTGSGLPGRDGSRPDHDIGDLQPSGKDDAPRRELTRLSTPDVDGADHLYRRIEVEHAGVAATQVRLCVAPSGSVDTVDVVAGSGMAEYDAKVVDSVQGWQYAAFAAPAETRVCENLTVAYHAR